MTIPLSFATTTRQICGVKELLIRPGRRIPLGDLIAKASICSSRRAETHRMATHILILNQQSLQEQSHRPGDAQAF
jgi:hypothetical protein